MQKPAKAAYDLAIVGGGVNGCGIARDAVMRGMRVILCEAGDLACSTSSASSKLIHGGLRYLEHGEIRLVKESLAERERLLRIAPHIIWPMRFVLVHVAGIRPYWMIRAGLGFYDFLAKRDILPACKGTDLGSDVVGKPLKDVYRRALEYSDCWVDDSRLVVLNALDAHERGATILTRTKLVSATVEKGQWKIKLKDKKGHTGSARAKVLVNATGPWASKVRADILGHDYIPSSATRLVQGSHIVLPQLFSHDRAYVLQAKDKRVVFAIPYNDKFTLVGTTDREYSGDPYKVQITKEETKYLLATINEFFARQSTAKDVVWSYSGVRGLYDDGAGDAQKVTRDYVIKVDPKPIPMVSVLGGKLTTYRKLAMSVVDACGPILSNTKKSTTADFPLPGGDMPVAGAIDLADDIKGRVRGIDGFTALRLARSYGTRAERIIDGAINIDDLGENLGCNLREAELRYLKENEWAMDAEDILLRRTSMWLWLDRKQRGMVAGWMEKKT